MALITYYSVKLTLGGKIDSHASLVQHRFSAAH